MALSPDLQLKLRERLAWLHKASGVGMRSLDRLAGRRDCHFDAILTRLEERAATDVEVGTLEAYAKVLGVRFGWLLDGDGEPPAEEAVRAAVELARAAHTEAAA